VASIKFKRVNFTQGVASLRRYMEINFSNSFLYSYERFVSVTVFDGQLFLVYCVLKEELCTEYFRQNIRA